MREKHQENEFQVNIFIEIFNKLLGFKTEWEDHHQFGNVIHSYYDGISGHITWYDLHNPQFSSTFMVRTQGLEKDLYVEIKTNTLTPTKVICKGTEFDLSDPECFDNIVKFIKTELILGV